MNAIDGHKSDPNWVECSEWIIVGAGHCYEAKILYIGYDKHIRQPNAQICNNKDTH